MSTLKFNNKVLKNAIRRHSKVVLEHFRDYNLEIESKFSIDQNKLEESFNKLKGEEKEELTEYYAEEFYMIEKVHTEIHRQSTLISIYSFLEHSLNSLCHHLYKLHDYPDEISDLRGKGISRAKCYLKREDLAAVDFFSLNREWSDLCKLNKVRNCIVHANGNVNRLKDDEDTEILSEIIAGTVGIELRNKKFVKIESTFIDDIITTIENFLKKLYSQTLSLNT